MVSGNRAQFSSRLGFIFAAAGSAIGLGNIWGFPTQAASNGGAAFLLIYVLMVFILAYPLLVAELTVGRYAASNPIRALMAISPKRKPVGFLIGVAGLVAVSGILSFYAIVAGWFLGYLFAPILELVGLQTAADWLVNFSIERNLALMYVFMILTILVVRNGVANGIEKWSTRLMPLLLVLFVGLVCYTLTQKGASEGLNAYLVPDFSTISPDMMVSAMGQAFFSLSIGVCCMMVYGSYLQKDANLPKTAGQVALLDTGVAFIAGLLILPAMFVAQEKGVEIFNSDGALLGGDTLVFQVLPALFESMGSTGLIVGFAFFSLMMIAALTSSISMLEVPVACASEEWARAKSQKVAQTSTENYVSLDTNAGAELIENARRSAAWLIGGFIAVCSSIIVFNFDDLFGLVISLTTEYAQPIIGLLVALMVGWIWQRNQVLQELKHGYPEIESGLFWKIWPIYVRVMCPILMMLVFTWPLL